MRLEVVGRLKIFSSVMGNWFIFISTLKQHEVYSTFSQIDSISAASCQVYGRVQVHTTYVHCKSYLFKNAQLKLAEYTEGTEEMD